MTLSELKIAPQTKILMVGYVLLLVAQLMRAEGKQYIPIVIVFSIIATVGLYVTNCTVVGHCNLYAWIISYMIAAFGLSSVAVIIFRLIKN